MPVISITEKKTKSSKSRWIFCFNFYLVLDNVLKYKPPPVLRPLYRIQVNLCWPAPPQLRTGGFCWWQVLLHACPCWWQHSAFRLERRCWSSPQQCYLHCLHTVFVCIKFQENATAVGGYFNNISYLLSNAASYFGNSAFVLNSRVQRNKIF